ncbi:MAG: type II toxin-antitoxin system RelE/ParE family toxin [Candidatus Rokubacteria bacterium]|nr:type II toxin-antitoxin system RelE/ParE family toxin [Candidatus Rokubacteria bacterium]
MADDPRAWRIETYQTAGGERPVAQFFDALTGRNQEEARALLAALREFGNQLRSPRSKPVREGVFELRGHQVRLFYTFLRGRRIVLLDGIIKKQDEIPPDVVKRVVRMKRGLDQRD